jgi:hypothetical protein
MYHTTTNGWQQPTAHVAVNRNRLKHYGEKVYLKHGSHFEIELFNPKTIKLLAKISLNGVQISSSGIVLLPGQRVFLERWLDEPKKFLFETYEVENLAEAKTAIAKNGKVSVEFYDEMTINYPSVVTFPWRDITTASPSNFPYGSTYYTSIDQTIGSSGTFFTTNSNSASRSIETGRAEKGEDSKQSFDQDCSSYSSWCSKKVELQILPASSVPVEMAEIRNYCSNCGTRIKNAAWKFCPSCGTQF